MKKNCSIAGCERPHSCKGLCAKHYLRQWRYGTTELTDARRAADAARRVHVRRTIADFPPPTPQPTPCRLWQGKVDTQGYGIRSRGGQQKMHRWVWEQAFGPLTAEQCVLHKCDNPACYRLDHLFVGTQRDNVEDARVKGRLRGRPQLLTELDKQTIRLSTETNISLARWFGVDPSHISRIRSGRR